MRNVCFGDGASGYGAVAAHFFAAAVHPNKWKKKKRVLLFEGVPVTTREEEEQKVSMRKFTSLAEADELRRIK